MSASPENITFNDDGTPCDLRSFQACTDLNDGGAIEAFNPTPPSVSPKRATTTLHTDWPDLPSKPTLAPALQLTFGVEIECYMLFRPDFYLTHYFRPFEEDILGYKSRSNLGVRHHITQVLQAAGVPTSNPWDEDKHKWRVDQDTSVTSDRFEVLGDGWEFAAVEIKTPILKYHPFALEQIAQVLSLIKTNFDDGWNFRFRVNGKCGLHVHVGSQERVNGMMRNAGMPFQVVRNLYTAAAFFEKQIQSVFPALRVKNKWARPLSYSYRDERDVHARVKRIEECSDYSSLFKSTGEKRDTAYDIAYLQELDEEPHRPVHTYGTIEFRQHHGTIDADDISSWVQFVCGLTRLAHRAGAAGFPTPFLERSKDKDMTFLDLLDSLNMGKLKEHYAKPDKMYEHPRLYP